MGDLTLLEATAVTCAIGAGALVQGSVGFGSALIAAPLLALIDPRFVPAPVIMASFTVTVLIALREHRRLNLRDVGWVVVGRIPGTILGVGALLFLAPRPLGLLFALLVIVAVVLLAFGRAPPRNRLTLLAAGLVSGVMGTVTSVGGPPVALMFHDAAGPTLRGTLSGYFLLSALISLGGLLLAGLMGVDDVVAYLVLVPGVVVGFALSHRTRAYLDRGYTRVAVLALSAVAAVGVVFKNL
ncbi:MAG: TSUP family transporter [Myxococcales bacterium]|nr:TSUP family transporter [Myxococcales bacterium]